MSETIRYRVRWRQMPWYLLVPSVYWLVRILADHRAAGGVKVAAVVVTAVFAAILGTVWRILGVDVLPSGLDVRGITGRRYVPWHDIDWVGVTSVLGQQNVRIRTRRGFVTLRAPVHTPFLAPDRDFAAKAGAIYSAWQSRVAVTSAGCGP